MKHFFWGGRGAWLRAPLRDRARGTGPSLAFNTIGDEGYVNSVQAPLSEIPGSALVKRGICPKHLVEISENGHCSTINSRASYAPVFEPEKGLQQDS